MSNLTYSQELDLVLNTCREFPEEFGLRAFPNDIFSVSEAASYYSRGYDNEWGSEPAQVMVYTCRKQEDGSWRAFAKGTVQELKSQMVPFND